MPLWRLLHMRPPRGWLRLIEFVPAVLGAAIFASVCFGGAVDEDASTTPTPASKFEPLKLVDLKLEPTTLRVGDIATLRNGICNNTLFPVPAAIYLGAQEQGKDPLIARSIDIIGRDTPEGRQRRSIEPGCIGVEPITAPLPSTFSKGRWQLSLRIIATGPNGELQTITETSPTFWVFD